MGSKPLPQEQSQNAVRIRSALHLSHKVLAKTTETRVKKHNIRTCSDVFSAEGKEGEK